MGHVCRKRPFLRDSGGRCLWNSEHTEVLLGGSGAGLGAEPSCRALGAAQWSNCSGSPGSVAALVWVHALFPCIRFYKARGATKPEHKHSQEAVVVGLPTNWYLLSGGKFCLAALHGCTQIPVISICSAGEVCWECSVVPG